MATATVMNSHVINGPWVEPQVTPGRVLIADDQAHIVEALGLLLRSNGYAVELAYSPASVLTAIEAGRFDAVLMDLNYARDTTSGAEGLDLLNRIRARHSELPVLVMTAWGSVPLAVEAMRCGARDFILKPWENAELLKTLRAQIELGRALGRHAREQERELNDARRIQQRLLPRTLPRIPGMEIAVEWRPASVVGGDYFDVLPFSESRVALCIGDVAGKGMAAALLMSNLQAAVKAYATEFVAPRELCERVNRIICGNSERGVYITFFYGLLDTQGKRLTYVNAGHLPPLLVRADGSQRLLTEGGPVLGEFANWKCAQGEANLQPGDRLAFYTDGVTEACDTEGREFGDDRLAALLAEHRTLGAAALKEQVMRAVPDFSSGTFHDDATLIVLAVG